MNRQLVAAAAAVSLAAGGLVVPAGPAVAADTDVFSTDFEGEVAYQLDDFPEPEPLEPECAEPPCEPVEIVSGGVGGYVPVSPVRILETRSGPGIGGAMPADTTLSFDVADFAGIPEDAGAVALNVAAEQALTKSTLTVWPTPTQDASPPPGITSLSTEPGRVRTAVVVSGLGANGQVSVHNHDGKVHLTIDIIGWFPSESDLTAVPPQRIMSTLQGNNKAKGRMGQDPIDVQVTGVADVPETGVAAVVLGVTSDWSTTSSAVRVWPSDQFPPASRILTTTPGHANTNLVIVAPGASGAVSVSTDTGETHLDLDVLGWLPEGSPFRLTSGVVLDTREDEPLAAGATVSVPVRGVAGVPEPGASDEEAHSVVLSLTSINPAAKTTVTVWPADDADEPPDIISLAGDPLEDVDGNVANTSLALVRLGPSGEISLHNAAAATHLLVDVVGWFANPTLATELAVPESTVVPEQEQVEEVVIEDDGTASVVLDESAEPAEIGEHLVLGVTEGTPDGFLGRVTAVETNPDGEQELVLAQARLEEVFPEGDFSLDMSGEDFELGEPELLAGDSVSLTARALSEGDSLYEITWEWESGELNEDCSLTGLKMAIGLGFDLEFAVKWRWFKKPVVTALVTLEPWALAELNDVQIECGFAKEIKSQTKVTMVGPVPVVYGYTLDIATDFYAGLKGLGLLSAEANAEITIGVDRNKFRAEVSTDFTYTPTDLGELWQRARNLTAYAMTDVWMRFYVHLYGVGPRIGVGPFVETFVTSDVSRPLWAVDVGYAGKVDLYIDLWFQDWSWTLFQGEIPVASLMREIGLIGDCSVYGPGYETFKPCVTKAPQTRPNGDTRLMADRIRLLSFGEAFFNLPPGPLRIVAPTTVPDATAGVAYTLELEKNGWFADDATWHPTVTDPLDGLSFREDGGNLLLSGTPNTGGIFRATVQLWHGPEPGDGYDGYPGDPDGCQTPAVGRTGCAGWYGPNPPPEVEIVVKVPPPGGLKTLYVDDDAPEPDPASPVGERWKWAYPQLKDALGAAASDPNHAYEIRVGGGTYTPGSERTDAFRMQPWTEIKGGYVGWDDLTGQPDRRDLEAHETILSGDIGVAGNDSDNSYHVFFHPSGTNLDVTAVLDGVTISGGNANLNEQHRQYGGGMYNHSSSPRLTNVRFENNSAETWGGGMYNYESSPSLTSVTFLDNAAASGGGMANDSSHPELTDVVFTTNAADEIDGGGMYNRASAPELTRVEFLRNTAVELGGGMRNIQSAPTLTDVVFDENQVTAGGGGGLAISGVPPEGPKSPVLTNVVFTQNQATNGAGGALHIVDQNMTLRGGLLWKNKAATAGAAGVAFERSGTVTLTHVTIAGNTATSRNPGIRNNDATIHVHNSIVWGNDLNGDMNHDPLYIHNGGSFDVQYSTVQGGNAGEGNINADPMFVDFAAGDLHLQPGSPAIDAGSDALTGDLATDLDGHARTILTVDMGADEFWSYPDAVADQASTKTNVAVVVAVAANDTDPDGNLDPTTVTVEEPPAHGSVSVDGTSGEVTYAPDANWYGVDTFVYQICDTTGLCDRAPVTVTVNATELTVDSLADTQAADGACTLREAILNANGDDQSGSTDCPAGSGADTITFAAGLSGSIVLTSGPLNVADDLTIQGPGADLLAVDGNAADRVLTNTAELELSGLTITNGRTGGASGGGGIVNSGAITITHSTISNNTAPGAAGLVNYGGTVTITRSTISGNTAPGLGGGISNAGGGTVTIESSTIAGNTAGEGGGIYNTQDSTLVVEDSTIAGNTGGGIANDSGTASVTRSIVASNEGGDCAGSITGGGFNLASDSSCGFALVDDPLLGGLADNGGPTLTMLPTSGTSPVIDAAGDGCHGTDQRGVTRPQGPACDIGAVEAVPVESSYEIVARPGGILWDDARTEAEAASRDGCSGHLVTITSQAESQLVIDTFGSELPFKWLGGYQDEPGDGSGDPAANWKWVTGEPWSFTYWQSGEPNDDGAGEDKLAVGGTTNSDELYSWVDIAGDRAFYGYVIEYDCPG